MAGKAVILMLETMQILEKMGVRIKKARLRRNIRAEQLAERAGISKGTLSAIEKGVPTVSIGAYTAVLCALDMESDLDKIAKECPKETDVYIRAIHSKWNDYLIFSQEADTVYKQSNKDFAKILSFIPGEKITVKWDRWGEETFIYDKEKNQYICEEKK